VATPRNNGKGKRGKRTPPSTSKRTRYPMSRKHVHQLQGRYHLSPATSSSVPPVHTRSSTELATGLSGYNSLWFKDAACVAEIVNLTLHFFEALGATARVRLAMATQ